ncbi:MAG: 1,4-dihydroxy-2-naphthoate polyprenyltransferase [Xanthomonadaceae bacterium]|jgi:1,4-dihydroxy-2-naphthoate octaprenyltransferase|nr:1,4-dihydroxy-2-naphthoate polyprenyltransferase [Xanthomonadaceae bacterium]
MPIIKNDEMDSSSKTLPSPEPNTVLNAWIVSLRLRTLPLACCGVILGSALATTAIEQWSSAIFWATLITAVLLQLLANLANDYGDFSKAADTPKRLGPKRGMQLGLISPAQMRKAIWSTSLAAVCSGVLLMILACDSVADLICFLALGVLSIGAALTYTLGRHAYGYRGLGDLSVFIFFGLVSVIGSYYLQTHRLDSSVLLPAVACGLLGVAVLNTNNMRDLQEDRRNGKITLAVRLGSRRVRYYHLSLLALSLASLLWSAWLFGNSRPWVWLFLLALPLFYQNAIATLHYRKSEQFRSQLSVVIGINIVALGGFAIGLLFT